MIKITIPVEIDFPYPEDLARIQKVLADRGYEADPRTCADLWSRYSDSMAAGWMTLPDTDDEVFGCMSLDILAITGTLPEKDNG